MPSEVAMGVQGNNNYIPPPQGTQQSSPFNTLIPPPTGQAYAWGSQVMPTLPQAWEVPSLPNPEMSSATWVRRKPFNNMHKSYDPMSTFSTSCSDNFRSVDPMSTRASDPMSTFDEEQEIVWAPNYTDAYNLPDLYEDEILISPDTKAYGYGHDGFQYGYSDSITAGVDSYYGLAPGATEELGMWRGGATYFRQGLYGGSDVGSVGEVSAAEVAGKKSAEGSVGGGVCM